MRRNARKKICQISSPPDRIVICLCRISKNSFRSTTMAITRHSAAYFLTVVMLCLPALWNGFPLMFDDVGGYLERWPTGSVGLGRSTVYGLLLWITQSAWFVPVLVFQA